MPEQDNYEDILYIERPKSHHRPMARAHRAKQFAPFAALKGFEESIDETDEKCARENPIEYVWIETL